MYPEIWHNKNVITHFVGRDMNINEECLLGYLKNPDELSNNTEILKIYNKILEQKFVFKNILVNFPAINYTESAK